MDMKTLQKLTRLSPDELINRVQAKLEAVQKGPSTTFSGDYDEGREDALKWVLGLLQPN